MPYRIIHGDALFELSLLPDNSVDSVVTDPPYGLGKEPDAVRLLQDWIDHGYHEITGRGFMGKEWDAFVPQPLLWKEVYRVLKPGGHVLSFFGTRTYDWGVLAMRLAGFEIRDCIQWVYGSGFPKSLDISKAIDKAAGAEREVTREASKAYKCGEVIKFDQRSSSSSRERRDDPATDEAKRWEGWGTALKPANEPIVLARKPLGENTVAANVLKHGTGGLNIDGCRVATTDDLAKNYNSVRKSDDIMGERGYKMGFRQGKDSKADASHSTLLGRFPSNFIHDGSDEVLGLFPYTKSGELTGQPRGENKIYNSAGSTQGKARFAQKSEGSAARFFYCAKASKADRNDGCSEFALKVAGGMSGRQDGSLGSIAYNNNNNHPTVKPTELMRYLCRLITPPGGTVLDPFNGSGSTGRGAVLEGFNYIGIELDEEYVKISEARIGSVDLL